MQGFCTREEQECRRRGKGVGAQAALSKLFTREGGAWADGAILPYVGHLQLISTL